MITAASRWKAELTIFVTGLADYVAPLRVENKNQANPYCRLNPTRSRPPQSSQDEEAKGEEEWSVQRQKKRHILC